MGVIGGWNGKGSEAGGGGGVRPELTKGERALRATLECIAVIGGARVGSGKTEGGRDAARREVRVHGQHGRGG